MEICGFYSRAQRIQLFLYAWKDSVAWGARANDEGPRRVLVQGVPRPGNWLERRPGKCGWKTHDTNPKEVIQTSSGVQRWKSRVSVWKRKSVEEVSPPSWWC